MEISNSSFPNPVRNTIMNEEICFPLNLSASTSQAEVVVYGYMMPFVLVLTLTTNTLTTAVLAQKTMRTSSNIILLAISLSDLLTVLVPAPTFIYMFSLGFYAEPTVSDFMCSYYEYFIDYIPTLFHTASIWLTLGLAAQRYVYICHPQVARVLCTQSRILQMISSIFFIATIHLLPRFFEKEVQPTDTQDPICMRCYADWLTGFGVNLYFSLYYWCRIVLVHFLPCLLLIILNALLLKTLRNTEIVRRNLMKVSKQESCRTMEMTCTTRMLVVIVSIFLATEIPLAIIHLLHVSNTTIVKIFDEEDYMRLNVFVIISNFGVILTYPLNLGIYCGMSRQFRETFQLLFIPKIWFAVPNFSPPCTHQVPTSKT